MDADAFRQLFERHFALNRSLWDGPISNLTEKLFRQTLGYSVGSEDVVLTCAVPTIIGLTLSGRLQSWRIQ
jgi:hypothetical protein